MRLLVVDHLDAMLPAAKLVVGAGHVGGGRRLDLPGLGQGGQGLQGARDPQIGMSAAQNELLGLDVKLDLPDAAPA